MNAKRVTSDPATLGYEEVMHGIGSRATVGSLQFGPFSLINHGETLYRGDKLVPIGSRARQILHCLLSCAGDVVDKRQIMEKVWPNMTVEENNLTVQIAALRRALGGGRDGIQYIVNVPRRGYRFVAPVRVGLDSRAQPATINQPAALTNLPVRLAPAIGLAEPIRRVRTKLSSSRLVTISGPAGVGKTTLSLHVAQSQRSLHPDGVWLVDLATITEVKEIASAVAATLRIEAGATNSMTTLVQALTHTKTLLLLDNCEHIIDAVADLATIIMRWCPDVVILATSREALRVSGEATYSLAPLEAPPDWPEISAEQALAYPAVQLFVERVTSSANHFALSNEDALWASRICRRLDGLPLALEFASALVGAFSLAEVAARLDDGYKLIQSDLRGAPLRHRTLTAALDWSYSLLSDVEKTALRRLAVFVGGFSLEGAAALTGVPDLGEAGALLAKLHSKSLITRDVACKSLRFRLLETIRAYGLGKLHAEGDVVEACRCHAVYYVGLLRRRRFESGARGEPEDAIELDNVRSAMRFACGADGDIDLATSLTSGALPIWPAPGLGPPTAATTTMAPYEAPSTHSDETRREQRPPSGPTLRGQWDQESRRPTHFRKQTDAATAVAPV